MYYPTFTAKKGYRLPYSVPINESPRVFSYPPPNNGRCSKVIVALQGPLTPALAPIISFAGKWQYTVTVTCWKIRRRSEDRQAELKSLSKLRLSHLIKNCLNLALIQDLNLDLGTRSRFKLVVRSRTTTRVPTQNLGLDSAIELEVQTWI